MPTVHQTPHGNQDLIFEFALTDTNTKSKSIASLLKRLAPRASPESKVITCDIATNLLQTCRAVYLETWTIPLSLDPHASGQPTERGLSSIHLVRLLPRQLGLLQRFDMSIEQFRLEGWTLHEQLQHLQPAARHTGVYFAPRSYNSYGDSYPLARYESTLDCALIPAEKEFERHFLSHILGKQGMYSNSRPPPWHSAMRVTAAKPITHLTLRMHHADWWAWTDDPTSTDEVHHLALDPSLGDGSAEHPRRPIASHMRALAESRRAGRHPEVEPDVGWAKTIAQMPDLRSFEMVLEMFASNKWQLDAVVEAAKTWRFGLNGGIWELVWDGEVGVSSWSRSGEKMGDNSGWFLTENAFEVRDVRFTRRGVA